MHPLCRNWVSLSQHTAPRSSDMNTSIYVSLGTWEGQLLQNIQYVVAKNWKFGVYFFGVLGRFGHGMMPCNLCQLSE